MTFTFEFDENETNLIWNILNNCAISGKDAPILTGIFQKMQETIRQQAKPQPQFDGMPEEISSSVEEEKSE